MSGPTLRELVRDARANASHTDEEWLAARLPLLLRAVAHEHSATLAALLPESTVFGESTRRGRLPLVVADEPHTYCDCPGCEGRHHTEAA